MAQGYWDRDGEAPADGAPADVAGQCPRCAGPVSQDGRRWSCEMAECGWGVWGEVAGATLTLADVRALLAGRETAERRFVSKAGRPFTARLKPDPDRWTEDGHLVFVFPERAAPPLLTGAACPVDGAPIAVRDRAYSCTRPKDADGAWCPVTIWREVAGHRVTPDEARALLAGEAVGPVQCRSKSGRPFRATLRWTPEDGVRLEFADAGRPARER